MRLEPALGSGVRAHVLCYTSPQQQLMQPEMCVYCMEYSRGVGSGVVYIDITCRVYCILWFNGVIHSMRLSSSIHWCWMPLRICRGTHAPCIVVAVVMVSHASVRPSHPCFDFQSYIHSVPIASIHQLIHWLSTLSHSIQFNPPRMHRTAQSGQATSVQSTSHPSRSHRFRRAIRMHA